jgi:RNA polymerase sigma factor for flagellar operon FliA
MDARAFFEANLDDIERVIRFTAQRQHLNEADAEDFASIVKLKLIENDYAVIRKFQGRSNFSTYITMVVQRVLLDDRIHHWGKWHASAKAKRLGDLALDLEQLLHRDGRSIDEALPILRARYPEATREELEQIAERLPQRRARRHMVDLSEAEGVATEESTDEGVMAKERQSKSQQLSCAMREALAHLGDNDRLLLQLHFDSGMRVADIARSLHIEQKLLYRRMDKLLRDLRAELERAGIDPRDIADLIGREGADLDFALGNS